AARRPPLQGRTTLHRASERERSRHAPGRHEAPSCARRCGSRARRTSRTPAHLGARAAAPPRGAPIPGPNLGAVGRCPRALASVRREVSDAGKRLVRSPLVLLLLLLDLGIRPEDFPMVAVEVVEAPAVHEAVVLRIHGVLSAGGDG